MLGLGRQTDYAARIVLHLARLEAGTRVPVREIASERLLPAAFVRRIVGRLASAGVLRTTRGTGGGVRLARSAAKISLLDVVRAMEGGVTLNRCVTTPQSCPLSDDCPVRRVWCDATDRVEGYLEGVKFDRLARRGGDG